MFIEIHEDGELFLINTDIIQCVYVEKNKTVIVYKGDIADSHVDETYEQMKELLIEPPIYVERPPMGEYDE